jgi:hypothetical protein
MKQQKKPVKKTGNDDGWCVDKEGTLSTFGYVERKKNGKRPNRVRCMVCKQRITPKTLAHDSFGSIREESEIGFVIPKHKVQKKKRK